MSGMEAIKPFLAMSRKGLLKSYFDSETEATDYAKERGAENHSTFIVAKVLRTIDPEGNVSAREAAAPPVTEAANG